MAQSSAPGKLFIAGEYAVLCGGTAIVAAVGARARARASAIDGDRPVFVHPVTGADYTFDVTAAGELQWQDQRPGRWAGLPEAVVSAWARERGSAIVQPAVRITVDTDEFYRSSGGVRRKLGLGSSAAATVALTGALASNLGKPSIAELAPICLSAHAKAQGGQGSGADVLAALNGGVIAASGESKSSRALGWPSGLFVVPVWSGEEAASSELVGRFTAYRRRDRRASERYVARLKACAAELLSAWDTVNLADVLSALEDYNREMLALDEAADIGINTDAHRAMCAIAGSMNMVYKISGAGGGDFGLAVGKSEQAASEVRAAYAAAGYVVPELEFGASGLEVEPS